ncbi:DNA-binding response regulator [Bacillus sp. HMF5848]|uniref:LuxR C-terminal-related transcriptional regulator n=1 Tax=Bacillus sp. HMF5848 TaxID=2495421 RepID=UPI000F79C1A6|nr:response regulator transcription factor [Bacillus sp. HMF5848]RSK26428.1 DNA-binding response regulator [Bacillus sp. HMF5848]
MKLMIVDDHPLVRRGLATILSSDGDTQLVGEAATIPEALRIIEQTLPDIILVDLNLSGSYGLDLVVEARKKGYPGKYVVLTSSAAEEDFKKAKEVNVDGFCLKEALPEELIYALQLIHKGRKYYDPAILELMMNMDTAGGKDKTEAALAELTPKELEVLKALGQGLSNRDIAEKLFISEYTVKKHVSQILSKLELTDRTQAALFANNKGLVQFIL